MLIGYARVSTQEQENNLQIDTLKRAGCHYIYEEKKSGSSITHRPHLQEMLASLQPGDTIVVYKLDRIARSLKDLLTIVEMIEAANAEFRSMTEHIDTKTPVGRMIFQMIGAFAEFERELIRERTRVGMAAAAARGSRLGRPCRLSASDEMDVLQLWRSGEHSQRSLARHYGVHPSSIQRAISRNEVCTPLDVGI